MVRKGPLACLAAILCVRAAWALHPTAQAAHEHKLQRRDAPHNPSTAKRRGANRRSPHRLKKQKRNASLAQERPLQPPSLVIAGIGDSGTTAVLKAFESLGLEHCSKGRDIFNEPSVSHHSKVYGTREKQISALLAASGGNISLEGYKKAGQNLVNSVRFLRIVARTEADCLAKKLGTTNVSDDVVWGFKEPHWLYFMPAAQIAFANRTKFLVVARDPRDICTNILQDQYSSYGKFFKRGLAKQNCFHWWAVLWNELLDNYEKDPNFAVLRVEDLVLPAPTMSSPSAHALQCVMKFAGLRPNFVDVRRVLLELQGPGGGTITELAQRHHSAVRTRQEGSAVAEVPPPLVGKEQAQNSLNNFHSHRNSYMGHHYFMGERRRKQLEGEFAGYKSKHVVHKTARRLGYDVLHFGLQTPESPAVCQ